MQDEVCVGLISVLEQITGDGWSIVEGLADKLQGPQTVLTAFLVALAFWTLNLWRERRKARREAQFPFKDYPSLEDFVKDTRERYVPVRRLAWSNPLPKVMLFVGDPLMGKTTEAAAFVRRLGEDGSPVRVLVPTGSGPFLDHPLLVDSRSNKKVVVFVDDINERAHDSQASMEALGSMLHRLENALPNAVVFLIATLRRSHFAALSRDGQTNPWANVNVVHLRALTEAESLDAIQLIARRDGISLGIGADEALARAADGNIQSLQGFLKDRQNLSAPDAQEYVDQYAHQPYRKLLDGRTEDEKAYLGLFGQLLTLGLRPTPTLVRLLAVRDKQMADRRRFRAAGAGLRRAGLLAERAYGEGPFHDVLAETGTMPIGEADRRPLLAGLAAKVAFPRWFPDWLAPFVPGKPARLDALMSVGNVAEALDPQARITVHRTIHALAVSVDRRDIAATAANNWGNALGDLARLVYGEDAVEGRKLFDQAFAKYEKAVHHKPDTHEAWNNWGATHGHLGQLLIAGVNPDESTKHFWRAAVCFFLGRNLPMAQVALADAWKQRSTATTAGRYSWGARLMHALLLHGVGGDEGKVETARARKELEEAPLNAQGPAWQLGLSLLGGRPPTSEEVRQASSGDVHEVDAGILMVVQALVDRSSKE